MQKESEIAVRVMSWLSNDGWDCYPEAQFESYGRRVDIAARRDKTLWLIECKTSLSIALLDQAYRWVSMSSVPTYISIATPSGPGPVATSFCRSHGIGILLVAEYINERLGPSIQRHGRRSTPRMIEKLHSDMKRFTPGGTAGQGFSTPWRRTMDEVKRFIARKPGSTMKEIINSISHHYRTPSTARSCLAQWLYEATDIRVVRDSKPFKYFMKDKL